MGGQGTKGGELPGDEIVKFWFSNYVQLPQYYELFIQNGFDSLKILKCIKDESKLKMNEEIQQRLNKKKQSVEVSEGLKNNEEGNDIDQLYAGGSYKTKQTNTITAYTST